jgi:hypothetical protein
VVHDSFGAREMITTAMIQAAMTFQGCRTAGWPMRESPHATLAHLGLSWATGSLGVPWTRFQPWPKRYRPLDLCLLVHIKCLIRDL